VSEEQLVALEVSNGGSETNGAFVVHELNQRYMEGSGVFFREVLFQPVAPNSKKNNNAYKPTIYATVLSKEGGFMEGDIVKE
jgi:hypothetical protein